MFHFFEAYAKSVSIFFLTKCEKCFNFFDKTRKVFQFFLTRCEKGFTFFDKMRKVFYFFRQNAKSVLLFSINCEKCFNFLTKCEKCFTFLDKMRKVFQFFLQNAKSVYKMQYRLGNFLLVYSFSSVFPNMYAKIYQIF